jgi:uncharacterized protein YfbU (UPF0304 family)
VELHSRPRNSHFSGTLSKYRSMIQEWRRVGSRYDLSEAEIEAIVKA